jgi:hypothetical protein
VPHHGGAKGWYAASSLLIEQTRLHVTRDSHVGSERYSDERVVISLVIPVDGAFLFKRLRRIPPRRRSRLLDQTLAEEKKTDEP